MGNIQIRDINRQYEMVKSVETKNQKAISNLLVISPGNVPMIVAGDMEGYITIAVINTEVPLIKEFNAHEDKSAKGVELIV